MANEVAHYNKNISDIIVRIQKSDKYTEAGSSDNLSPYVSYISPTYSYVSSLIENVVLKDIARNLWSAYLYNQEYISFILGTYTKEEFKEIAKKYAQPFNDKIDKRYLYFASKTAFEVLSKNLTSGDLSLLLNVDTGIIENEMAEIGYEIPETTEDE